MGKRHLALAIALAVAGCGTAPSLPLRRETLARQIADDAAAFNEAYGRAVTAQILLNVLRSRDRLPRFYLAMTGIQDAPSLRFRENIGVGSIPMGEGASPWGFGNFGLERETISRPTYAVQPFSADTLTRTAFQATDPDVFEHYWQSGWPRDLLLFVLVDGLTRIEALPDGQTRVTDLTNEANDVREDCAPDVDSRGCAFVREVRGFLRDIAGREPVRGAPADARGVCGLIAAYAPAQPVRRVDVAGQRCEPRFIVGAVTYVLHLRSLDDAIYYVGELMRADSMRGEDDIVAPITVLAAGLRGGGAGVPLFRITRAHDRRRAPYAASVDYAGERYWAGPAIGRSCADAQDSGACVDDAENGDRTSSVISLLAEILALNQSPDSIRAPNRLIAE